MGWPTLKTFDRIDIRDSAALAGDFDKSYLGIRFVIGSIGLALPLLLVFVDALFLEASADVRGSMSAYYHSPARDLFIGGLTAIGVTLISYLWWRWDTWDYWLSLFAGVGILGVAAFPTGRPGVEASAISCSNEPPPGVPACAPLQALWGEGLVESLHFLSTSLVVASFASLCLVFALRDFGYGIAAHKVAGHDAGQLGVGKVWRIARRSGLASHLRWTPRTILYAVCLGGVLSGALWALGGPNWLAPRGYVGEFIAFSSFGWAWMIASWDLLNRLARHRS